MAEALRSGGGWVGEASGGARAIMSPRGLLVVAGGLLLVREAVFYAAFGVLASSINWPGSLALPASEALPLIHQHGRAVFLGYYLYLLSSVLFLPIAMALRATLRSETPAWGRNLLLDMAAGFAAVSVVMRALGILRWLFAMPALAVMYTDPASTPAMRDAAALQFELLNNYAGNAGEHLGVHLFAALFMGCFGVVLLRTVGMPKVFGVWALISAALFVPVPDLLGIDGGPILFINGFTYSFWAMALGGYLLLRSRR